MENEKVMWPGFCRGYPAKPRVGEALTSRPALRSARG